jgi:hypothetical protein
MASNWENKTTVKKGNIGQEIVRNYLESKGWIVYIPVTEGPHAFDNLAIKNKEQLIIADMKTKPARKYYPDTGFDLKHYNCYLKISVKHSIPVFVFWVDQINKKVYGNFISRLSEDCLINIKKDSKEYTKKYPSIENGIIFFPLIKMITIASLTDKQCEQLKELSTDHYGNH